MVTFDCTNAGTLARWWAQALDVEIAADYGEFVMVAAGPLHLGFQNVPESKQVKNRVHLDFEGADYDADIKRLVELGAEAIGGGSAPGGFAWTTLRDPEGNEFDVANGAD